MKTGLHLALADSLFGLRRYQEAIDELQVAEKLAPGNSATYALLARAYAHLGDREQTLRYVGMAEQGGQSNVFVSTGEALSIIGERDSAMQRFAKALAAPGSDRLSVRLAIGKLMAQDGEWEDARRQVALGLMEVRGGQAPRPRAGSGCRPPMCFWPCMNSNWRRRSLSVHWRPGAPETSVRIGLANSYLARGDTPPGRSSARPDRSREQQQQRRPVLRLSSWPKPTCTGSSITTRRRSPLSRKPPTPQEKTMPSRGKCLKWEGLKG